MPLVTKLASSNGEQLSFPMSTDSQPCMLKKYLVRFRAL
jgi:hypothetical protein